MQVNHGICTAFMLRNIKEHLTTAILILYLRTESKLLWGTLTYI